ncbi:MAG: hypothetical protein QNJ09_12130 [Paracoccaceae bacterium]|nr:hypothetical protein [Paracoccaceae bacterium]
MLSKLTIVAYEDEEYRSKIGDWTAQINPERYSRNLSTVFAEDRGIDTGGTVSRFQSQSPESIDLDFTIDATGVVDGVTDLAGTVDAFDRTAHRYNGDNHSQNYLKLIWGDLVFQCMLARLKVQYTLFAPSGKALRALLQTSFRQHQTPQQIARRARNNSPDLTHTRVVEAGKSLPLMCQEIYKDPGFYASVARANGLDSLTILRPGTRLRFPPAGS